METCKICKLELRNIRKLSYHIKQHNISGQKYYDDYIGEPNDNSCKTCGKGVSFIYLAKGYATYCSRYCAASNYERIQKILDTKTAKYGKGHAKIYEKQQNTVNEWSKKRKTEFSNKLSAGVRQAHLNDPNIKNKIADTKNKKYIQGELNKRVREGHLKRSPEQIAQSNYLRKQTNISLYGVESHTQTPAYRKLMQKINNNRSDSEREEIYNKMISTKTLNGTMFAKDDATRSAKATYKAKCRRPTEISAKTKFSDAELVTRGLAGQSGATHLDHIVSLDECFHSNIPIEIACHGINLQLIPWKDNILKYNKSTMSPAQLTKTYKNFSAR